MAKLIIEDTTLKNIADAIRNKNGETSQYLPAEMPAKIEEIQGGGSGKGICLKYVRGGGADLTTFAEDAANNYMNLSEMFLNVYGTPISDIEAFLNTKMEIIDVKEIWGGTKSKLARIDLSKWNVTNCISLGYLFQGCSNLIEVTGLSNWDTSNINYFGYMFKNCPLLEAADVQNWNTSKVENMYETFSQTSLPVEGFNWDVSNVSSANSIFSYYKGSKIDIGNWEFKSLTSAAQMFNKVECETIILPNLPKVSSTVDLFGTENTIIKNVTWGEGNTFGQDNTSTVTLNLAKIWHGTEFAPNYETFAISIAPNTTGKTRTIKLFSTLYHALTDEQKAILTAKGYTITYGTS